jgi:lipopolysaccharide/colanic/teichoic acid biosynthesis glycosyltransferase
MSAREAGTTAEEVMPLSSVQADPKKSREERDDWGFLMAETLHHRATQSTPVVEPLVSEPTRISVPARRIGVGKRMLDLALAIPAALITLPIVLVLAAISFALYREMPFFRQPRVGHGGKEFTFWKIRTLPSIAPDTADKYQLRSMELPKFANVLRAHHLDELPQLWLVIAGKMTLVGPRPEMPTLSASFDQQFVAKRVSVKPGCTGLWQISRGSRGLIGESPEWDTHYVEHATVRLDLWIMFGTVLMMAKLREVTALSDIPRWTGAAVRPESSDRPLEFA